MISGKLVRRIQDSAGRLTTDLVHELQRNARSQAYRNIPPDQLIELKSQLYENLGRWLASRSRFALESRYRKVGRERFLAGIPLSQVIFALTLTKSMLLQFIRKAVLGESEDLVLEHELCLAIAEFFDEAIYCASAGYEDARHAAGEHLPQAEAAPRVSKRTQVAAASQGRSRRPPKTTKQKAEGPELPLSRAGDIGETAG